MTTSSPDRPSHARVSAVVTTYNEERQIGACLDSLSWCDEIVVVDSHSTDRTAEIVAGYPQARWVQHEYFGGAAQKNWSMRHASNEWLLFFDADERCTPALRNEIETILVGSPTANGYTIHRRVFFLGKQLRYSGWRNDRVVRLIRRGTARYQNRRVHARMITRGPAPRLRHSLDHFMVDDLAEYVQRATRYGVWGAAQCLQDGKHSGPIEFVLRPLWRFFRNYVLFRGFLDGTHGLVDCAVRSWATYVKWSVLWNWRRLERHGIRPALPRFDTDPSLWDAPEIRAPGSEPEPVESSPR